MRRPHDIFFKSVFQDPKRTTALLRAAAKKNPSLQEFINVIAEALRFSAGTWLRQVIAEVCLLPVPREFTRV
jgi:hypothetical protein